MPDITFPRGLSLPHTTGAFQRDFLTEKTSSHDAKDLEETFTT